MNNNNLLNPSTIGFDADSFEDGVCVKYLFDKLLGNEKQCNEDFNLDLLNEFDDSLLKQCDDFNNEFFGKTEEKTYTINELLDLAEFMPDDQCLDYEKTLEFLPSESQNHDEGAVLDTVLASPLSSSTEESCDLDEILFHDELLESPISNGQLEVTEVLDSSLEFFPPELEIQLDNVSKAIVPDHVSDELESEQINSFQNHSNGIDLDSLFSQLTQTASIGSDENLSLSLSDEEPSSPSSVSSAEEGVRYSPYSKKKKQKTPEQRLRKKNQNRNAASRYRMKKKDELKAMNAEAEELVEKNKELSGKVAGLRTEIDYLKNLMLDVIKARLAKGTLPKNFLSSLNI